MLSEEFLRNCLDMFSVPSKGLETTLRVFPQKYLNIIDPLKENNNLGRSVHRGMEYLLTLTLWLNWDSNNFLRCVQSLVDLSPVTKAAVLSQYQW